MAPQLPQHLPRRLKDLVNEISDDYLYKSNVLLRNRKLITEAPEKGVAKMQKRNYRFWLRNTGEEIEVKYYTQGNKLGVLVGNWGSPNTSPVILARDPNHKTKMFKGWHGVRRGFGRAGDDTELVEKDLGKPDWVKVVRGGRQTYQEWVADKTKQNGEYTPCSSSLLSGRS
jgi:hypothetical protein